MKEEEKEDQTPFAKWLEEHKYTACEFARRTFISPPTIYKAMRGGSLRKSTIKKIIHLAIQLCEDDFKKVDYSYLTVAPNSRLP